MIQDIFSQDYFSTSSVAIIGLISAIVYYLFTKDKNLPPGPTGLPIVGYWPFFKQGEFGQELRQLAEKYGDVCSVRVAGTLFIFLNSQKAMREVYITKADCFNTRCESYNLFLHMFDEGILYAAYEEWKTLRKFFVLKLRDFGLASLKDNLADPMHDIISDIILQLKNTKGEPVNLASILTKGCIQMMTQLVLPGSNITEDELQEILLSYSRMFMNLLDRKMLATGSISKYILLPMAFDYKNFVKDLHQTQSMLDKIIARHLSTLDEDNPRNIIDQFYIQKNKLKMAGDPSANYFTDKALKSTLIVLMGDGSVSVANFITLFINELLEHPDIQEKIYEELTETVGLNRQPSIADKSRLLYTNAVFNEVIRISDFFPAFPSVQCTKETVTCGYRIPKGSVTVINFWPIHHDPKAYKDPNTFNPLRFISKPNEPKADLPIMFGMGKRSCIGEAFAMNQAYLNVTTIIKNFKLVFPQDKKNKSAQFEPDAVMICAIPREKE